MIEGRVDMYGMLAQIYKGEIDEAGLNELKKMRCPLNTGNRKVDEGYRLFHAYLSSTWERSVEELQKDYLRTFLGSNTTAYSCAYPHESVYTSPERLIMQDARDEVLALYRAAGFDKDESWKDGEDHIALELDFERLLAARSAQALRENDEAAFGRLILEQYNFLLDHLLNWAPLFVQDMHKFAQTDFYQALAHLTMGFLETDKEFLEDLIAELSLDASIALEGPSLIVSA
jgi:TorA maturation chaperone TorD